MNYITVKEYAQKYHLSLKSVYEWCNDGLFYGLNQNQLKILDSIYLINLRKIAKKTSNFENKANILRSICEQIHVNHVILKVEKEIYLKLFYELIQDSIIEKKTRPCLDENYYLAEDYQITTLGSEYQNYFSSKGIKTYISTIIEIKKSLFNKE